MLETIGITEYLHKPEFEEKTFFIKQKNEDFIVKEILMDGLCSDIDGTFDVAGMIEATNILEKEYKILFFEQLKKYDEDFIDILKNSKEEAIIENLTKLKERPNSSTVLGCIKIEDKEKRKTLHLIARKHPFITTKINNEGIFEIIYDVLRLDYVSCIMKKVDRNTIDACNFIAKKLNKDQCDVQFAGNKDKKAITYQKITIKNTCVIDMLILLYYLRIQNKEILIGHICRSLNSMKLGECLGNRFEIKVRYKKDAVDRNILLSALENLKNGFINYYGPQRFGKRLNNHLIGELLVKNQFKEALEAIIEFSSDETEDHKNATILFKNEKYTDAEELLPPAFVIEKKICRLLNRKINPKNIFRYLRREYVSLLYHSYQSYIFNLEASKLIRDSKKNEINASETIIELEKKNNKYMKGASRKVMESLERLEFSVEEDCFTIVFDLKTSCYATSVLREIVGNDILFNKIDF